MSELVQQINLYRISAVHESSGLTFRKMLLLWGIVIFCLVGYTGFLFWDKSKVKNNYEQSTQESIVIKKELEQKIVQLQTLDSEESLRQEINQLIEKRNEQSTLISILMEQGLQQTGGFSPILKALSEKHIQGTWYTTILLQNDGQYVTLKGTALQPALIPNIFDALDQASLFEGKSFDTVSIQADAATSYVNFDISSQSKRKE